MAVDVFDEDGPAVREAEGRARLHAGRSRRCRSCSGTTPTAQKYRAAYFERFPGIWATATSPNGPTHGGIIIHGRSDATLNPGGVRIGTAEIYAQVEGMPEVVEALAIGQDWDNDVRIVLFVRLAAGVTLDDALVAAIKIANPRRRLAAPRAGEDRRGRRHPAHEVGQDHRARGARHRARAGGEEQGSARQSGGAGAFSDLPELAV